MLNASKKQRMPLPFRIHCLVSCSMLEVVANLPERCVFLAGEPLECKIAFTNTVRKNEDGSPAKYVSGFKLQWCEDV